MKITDTKTTHGHHTEIKFANGVQRDAWFDELNRLDKFTDNRGHNLTRVGKTDEYRMKDGRLCKISKIDIEDDLEYKDDEGIKHNVRWDGTEFQYYSNLDATSLKDVYRRNLPKLDKNRDGDVSISEIKTALEDRSIVGHSAKVLYSINKHFLKFASLNDDGKSKKEVVTGQDIDQFHAYLTRLHNDELFAKTVTMAHAIPFSGYLTSKIPAFKEQIDKASFVSEIENEVGWSNIKFPSSSPLEQGAFGWMNPKHSIVPQACTQSEMGDCVVVSSMAAIAKTHPDLIQKMIKENKDGSFDVTLPGESKHPYHVTLSDTEKVIYEIPNDEGMWPAIVKKAYGMHAMKITQANEHRRKSAETPWWAEMLHPGTRDAVKLQENANCPADYIGAGNFPEHVLGTLTGRPTNSKWVGYTKLEDLDQKLKEIVDKKIPAVACSNPIILGNPLVPSKYPDVFSAHGYTVMGYDPKKKVVELRNPWGMGQKDINSHGVFKLPLDEFKDKFLWLSYTTDKQEWNFDTTVAVIRIVDKVIDRLDDSNKQKK